jgi:hypothetical protein
VGNKDDWKTGKFLGVAVGSDERDEGESDEEQERERESARIYVFLSALRSASIVFHPFP